MCVNSKKLLRLMFFSAFDIFEKIDVIFSFKYIVYTNKINDIDNE